MEKCRHANGNQRELLWLISETVYFEAKNSYKRQRGMVNSQENNCYKTFIQQTTQLNNTKSKNRKKQFYNNTRRPQYPTFNNEWNK